MKIARYWRRQTAMAVDRRGQEHHAGAWGWSSTDPEEAATRARAAAGRIAEFLAAGELPHQRGKEYLYSAERPPREEVLQEFHDASGETSAFLSRNSYGALVLNTRDLMFIDVDFEPPPGKVQRFIARLRGGGPSSANGEDAVRNRIQSWCIAHPEIAARVYRTYAGFRVVIVNQALLADSEQARQILDELGSDVMYRRLCELQQSFRARLTPKPWRIHQSTPPARFPFVDEKAERRYRKWEQYYERACVSFSTCRLVKQSSCSSEPLPELAPLLELHDSLTRANENLPLA
jgi:hypothetical protein